MLGFWPFSMTNERISSHLGKRELIESMLPSEGVMLFFCYLAGTQDYGITFAPDEPSSLIGYTDSDYGGCIDS